jgi:hypothetical protein
MGEIKPGLYRDIPFEEYNAWPYVRNSDLSHFNRTPAHARERMLNRGKTTAAMEFGRAYHSAMLEPQKFPTEFVAGIKVDKRTTKGKEEWADFQAENADKTVIDPEDYAQIVAMRDRLKLHPVAKDLLYGAGQSEVSIVWVDPDTGLTCKSRIDRVAQYNGRSYLVDLKTTEKDASEKGFQNTMARYYYHQQAGMYSAGMEVLFPGPYRPFVFIVQEKEPPYEPGCYELDDFSVKQGTSQFRRHLAQLKACVTEAKWPGHGDGLGLIGIPQWAANQDELVG